MALYIVSTPIGNLEDITLRALAVLEAADRVYAEDTRRTRILFDRHGIKTTLRSLHAHNEAARVEEVLGLLDDGSDVALVSDAGTPLVSDPGDRLVRAVLDHGHEVVPIPGASAPLAALVASGLPTARFTFLGFLPRKKSLRRKALEDIAERTETVVLFEAPGRLEPLLDELAAVAGSERTVAVARELTKRHEEVFRGTVEEALGRFRGTKVKGEITVVVAPRAGDPESDMAGVQAFAASRLAEGARPTDVVRDVMERFGVAKNLAYRLVQEARE